MYLLPAGESAYLDGTIKSMVIDPYSPTESFQSRISRRSVPLFDLKILVVTGKGKNATEDAKVKTPSQKPAFTPFFLTFLFSFNGGLIYSVIIILFFMLWGREKFIDVLR